jgi:PAS domain S-box-containing protein
MNPEYPSAPKDDLGEVSALLDTLRRTGQRLEELVPGDTVVDSDGRTLFLLGARDKLKQRQLAKQDAIVNALVANITQLDDRLTTSPEDSWRHFASSSAPGHQVGNGLGSEQLEFRESASGDEAVLAQLAVDGIRSVLNGSKASFTLEYQSHLQANEHRFRLTVTPSDGHRQNGTVVMHSQIIPGKQAASELLLLADRLSLATAVAGVGVWEWNLENDILTWDDTMFAIYGFPPRVKIPYGRWSAAVHPEDLPAREAALEKVIDEKGEGTAEFRIVLEDGSTKNIAAAERVVLDLRGEVVRVVGVNIDITDRRAAEAENGKAENRFRDIFNRQFHLMAILSPEGRILEANATSVHVAGVDLRNIVGRHIWETPISKNLLSVREKWIYLLRTAERTRNPVVLEAEIDDSSGRARQIELTLTAVKDARDQVEYYIAQAFDITGRKLAEQKILESEALLRVAGRIARLGGWSLDLLNRELRWTDEVFAIHELEPGSPPSWDRALEFYAPEWREVMTEAVNNCIHEGTPFDLESEIVTANDRRIWVRSCGQRNTSGSHIRGAIQEITGTRHTEKSSRAMDGVREVNASKSTFLAHVSHEIRTPMNGVIGMLDVLYQTELEHDQIEMLDLIRDSTLSLLRSVNDILDFSEIEAGNFAIDRAPLSPASVVEKSCEDEDQMAVNSGVELTLFTDPNLPAAVLGDAVRLRQVLVNLVNNAIKFSRDVARAGEVSVRAVVMERTVDCVTVEFRVADNGIGMDEDTLSRLFTSFTQADESTTRRYEGMGLGLGISSRLVHLMGGTIRVHSTPGIGSEFEVRLPFATLPGASEPVKPESLLLGLQCRVVGERRGIADDLATYLSDAGASVERSSTFLNGSRDHESSSLSSGPLVWIIVVGAEGPSPETVRAMQDSSADQISRFVVVARGIRIIGPVDTVSHVDRHLLTRQAFLAVVARAAGRAQADGISGASSKQESSDNRPPHIDQRGEGRRILVAEDNLNNQRVILRQLGLLGYSADIANTGRDALELWRSGIYELLVTDLHMPEMDGYELVRAIRSEAGRGSRLPVIALTATATRGEQERCRTAGMDDYLTKPTRLLTLQNVLEKWLPPRGRTTRSHSAPATNWGEDDQPIKLGVLASIVGDDPLVLRQFVEDFRVAASKTAIDISRACQVGDVRTATDAAHQLKSSARTVGAMDLAELCQAIETAGGAADIEKLKTHSRGFELEMAKVLDYVGLLKISPI